MTYIGAITYDHATTDANAASRLTNALVQAGWEYSGRSALVLDSDDIEPVQLALEVLARALETPGPLTALSIQVQRVGVHATPPAAANHARALARLLNENLPSERKAGREKRERSEAASRKLNELLSEPDPFGEDFNIRSS